MRPSPSRPTPIIERVAGSGTPETGDWVAAHDEVMVWPAPASHAKMFAIVSLQLLPVQPKAVRSPLRVVEKFPTYAVKPVALEPT